MVSLGKSSFDFIIKWEEWGTLPTYLSTKSNCWVFFNIITALSWLTSRKDWLFNINISSPTYLLNNKTILSQIIEKQWMNLSTCDIETYLGLSDTFIPCLDATEVWSTPVMNMPSPYSIPPLIINPRLSSGLRLNDTWVQKWFFQTNMLISLVKNICRSSS